MVDHLRIGPPHRAMRRCDRPAHFGNNAEMIAFEAATTDQLHVNVSDLDQSQRFYDRVMELLGWRKTYLARNGEPLPQYRSPRTRVVLQPATRRSQPIDHCAPGLHQLSFRVASHEAVDRVARALERAGIDATEPRLFPEYAPDYYATFLLDPDGVRLEVASFS